MPQNLLKVRASHQVEDGADGALVAGPASIPLKPARTPAEAACVDGLPGCHPAAPSEPLKRTRAVEEQEAGGAPVASREWVRGCGNTWLVARIAVV